MPEITKKYAIMVDGGFLKKRLYDQFKRVPAAEDIVDKCNDLGENPHLRDHELFRIFYYDAPPLSGELLTNPIDNSVMKFSDMKKYSL